jgi:uncharacterized protein YndB with AHSA1/START domain
MIDLIAELERVRRAVGSETGATGPSTSSSCAGSTARRSRRSGTCARIPSGIPRWFLPIAGDLRLGGRFQLEGNAGGEITECRPPRRLAVTWELALLGLALHLRTGGSADEARDFASSAEGQAYMRRNAAEWGAAHAASGAPDETADEAAARTSAAYAPDP